MTDLYRFFDDDGELLYVGITDRGPRRWREHMAQKEWWDEVATVKLEKHPSRKAAQRAEVGAIRREHPVHNVAHSRRKNPPAKVPVDDGMPVPVEIPVVCDCRDCLGTIRGVLRRHPGSVPVVVKFYDRPIRDAGAPPVVRRPVLFGELKAADIHRTPEKSSTFRNMMLTLNEFPHLIAAGTVEQYRAALSRAGFSVANAGLIEAAVAIKHGRVLA